MKPLLTFLILPYLALPAWGYSVASGVYTTDGSFTDVSNAVGAAVGAGTGTVNIPAGAFTWGTGGAFFSISAGVILQGAGQETTTITMAADAPSGAAAAIRMAGPAVIKDFTINGTNDRTPFSSNGANGWRLTNIEYLQSDGQTGYFVFAESYGLIDHCRVRGGSGTSELIFSRGPADSWTTASGMGSANALFVEDNVFWNYGYVCDGNDNARMVLRGNSIHGQIKIDGHGYASNSLRGVRQMEIYRNTWPDAGYFAAIEVRGGTGMIFNNTAAAGSVHDWFFLTDYGYLTVVPNFGNVLQQPSDYPLKDQIGVGMDPKAAASEPMYVWGNANSDGAWPRTLKDLPAESEAATEREFIQANRDFYATAGFDDATGMSVGTASAMAALTPGFAGYGYWVTDEGEWDSTNGATPDGRLYRYNGSTWVLHYTPYTYPHPLVGGSPPSGGAATAGSGSAGTLSTD